MLSRADLELISGCHEIEGDIIVENYPDTLISLNNLERVKGSIIVHRSTSLIRFEAMLLEYISETFQMDRLQSLAMINTPSLHTVKSFDLRVLPILTHMTIDNLENVESLRIADTSLVSFTEVNTSNMTSFDINNNRYMETVSADVELVTSHFHIAGNGRNIRVDVKNLKTANNVTVSNVESLNLDSLEEVQGSVSILENNFSVLSLPQLQKVGGSMRLADNRALARVQIGALKDIDGGLLIVNNTLLNDISFLPKLTVIGGGLDVEGNIVTTLWPSLKFIKGAAKITTTNVDFDCNQWLHSEVSEAMRGGDIQCRATGKPVVTRGASGKNSSTSRDESDEATSAASRTSFTRSTLIGSLTVVLLALTGNISLFYPRSLGV